MNTISGREASIFACFADVVVAPQAPLPAVADTDLAAAFDTALAAGPALNRAGLRLALYALEVAPLALGFGARLRRLPPERRIAVMARLERGALAGIVKALRGIAQLSYYGDSGVMRTLGYDAAAVVARAREAAP